MIDYIIESKRLLLRPFTIEDITSEYVEWMNNPLVTNFLEARHVVQTYEEIAKYINSFAKDDTKRYWGIFEKSSTLHIGSVTLNSIHPLYKTADISFVIGALFAQKKGYATEAVNMVCDYAFNVMALRRITGSHYSRNIGSLRVFQHNGFTQEGLLREQYIDHNKEFEDKPLHGLLVREFIKHDNYFYKSK